MATVVNTLIGDVNGVNKVFTTPTAYAAGSLRPIWNGSVYEQADARFGCVEDSNTQITLTLAPYAGEVIQAIYHEDVAEGSPFDPLGILP